MARIIVTTDRGEQAELHDPSVLLEERVYPVHLATDHGASQLMERVAWAVGDAERTERAQRAM